VSSFSPDRVEVYIEIRGVYDGWSVAKMKDGTLVNRWNEDDRRFQPTQDWINNFRVGDQA
jgi:hypothetical protein